MIKEHLGEAIEALKSVIELTNKDIENIKVAKHDEVMPHTQMKTKLLSEFEASKKALDAELVELAQANPNQNLADLLGDDVKEQLGELREVLLKLKDVNREYAKSVVVVKDFFDSLVSQMLGKPAQNNYTDKALGGGKDDIFKARV